MGETSASVNGAGPVKENRLSRRLPPGEPASTPGGDPTIDFRAVDPAHASAAGGTPPPARSEYSFLGPPRDGDELGWLSHYRVRGLIGSGGMGLVFLADDTQLLRPVALKVIRPELASSPEAAARFVREARSAAAIKHDHIVTIYQVGEAQGVAFLAMEYLQGISLQHWLDRGRTASIDQVLRIGREVASGLAAAHRSGLVHRDIKPANIWLEAPGGRAKILDFGQARAESEDVQITRAGTIMGTPAFMSPEQAEGNPVGPKSDLFSLGCVLYRLCSGQLPFQGKTILSVLTALASQTPVPPLELRPEMPEELSSLVMRLLEKSPEVRPESAQAVVDELRAIDRRLAARRQSADLEMGNTPTPVAPRAIDPMPDCKGHLGFVLAASGVIAALALSAIWFGAAGPRKEPRSPSPSPSSPAIASSVPFTIPSAELPAGSAANQTDETSIPVKPVPRTFASADVPQVTPPIPPRPAATPPTPSKAAGPVPEPAAPMPPPLELNARPTAPEELWGVLVDPDGDCRLSFDEGHFTASLFVPGRPHVLSAELRKLNAPRLFGPSAATSRLVSASPGPNRWARARPRRTIRPIMAAGSSSGRTREITFVWRSPPTSTRGSPAIMPTSSTGRRPSLSRHRGNRPSPARQTCG